MRRIDRPALRASAPPPPAGPECRRTNDDLHHRRHGDRCHRRGRARRGGQGERDDARGRADRDDRRERVLPCHGPAGGKLHTDHLGERLCLAHRRPRADAQPRRRLRRHAASRGRRGGGRSELTPGGRDDLRDRRDHHAPPDHRAARQRTKLSRPAAARARRRHQPPGRPEQRQRQPGAGRTQRQQQFPD